MIQSREAYDVAIYTVGRLMESDPHPQNIEGKLLRELALACKEYETIHFNMEPRLPCDKHKVELLQVQGEPMVFKFVCTECEKRVQIIDGKMEVIE
jgi:hypothetical protein